MTMVMSIEAVDNLLQLLQCTVPFESTRQVFGTRVANSVVPQTKKTISGMVMSIEAVDNAMSHEG